MKSTEETKSAEPATRLLTGGNPQIPKGDGEGPVRSYIGAMPGWKRATGETLDTLIDAAVPGVRRAVRWNTPFYGSGERGWFMAFSCTAKYVKVAFFRGAELDPVPPVESRQALVRYFHVFETEPLDEAMLVDWIRQAAGLPGEPLF